MERKGGDQSQEDGEGEIRGSLEREASLRAAMESYESYKQQRCKKQHNNKDVREDGLGRGRWEVSSDST